MQEIRQALDCGSFLTVHDYCLGHTRVRVLDDSGAALR